MRQLIGMRVGWATYGGDKYSGTVIELDSNVLHVKCDDGEMRAVGIGGVYLLTDLPGQT